jgi:hypothetical protein
LLVDDPVTSTASTDEANLVHFSVNAKKKAVHGALPAEDHDPWRLINPDVAGHPG